MGKSTGFLEYERVENAGQNRWSESRPIGNFIPRYPKRIAGSRAHAAWTAAYRSARRESPFSEWFPAVR